MVALRLAAPERVLDTVFLATTPLAAPARLVVVTVRLAAARLVAPRFAAPARLGAPRFTAPARVVAPRFAAPARLVDPRLAAPARVLDTVFLATAPLAAPARPVVVTVRLAAARLPDRARLVVFGFVPTAPGPRVWRSVDRTRLFAGFAAVRRDDVVLDDFFEAAFDLLFLATSDAVRAGLLRLPDFLAGTFAADRLAVEAGRERSIVFTG